MFGLVMSPFMSENKNRFKPLKEYESCRQCRIGTGGSNRGGGGTGLHVSCKKLAKKLLIAIENLNSWIIKKLRSFGTWKNFFSSLQNTIKFPMVSEEETAETRYFL